MKTIIIDAGHNFSGFDTGAEGNGLREQDVTFKIAEATGEILRGRGFKVILTRNEINENVGSGTMMSSLQTRADIANRAGADLFLSVHTNAFVNAQANGTECYVYSLGGEAEKCAKKICWAIVSLLKTRNRGVLARPSLAVLRLTKMPAVLIETAFISNPEEAEKLSQRTGDFARAIADGAAEYLGAVRTNRFSYDDTVDAMVRHGVTDTQNMEYWERGLAGGDLSPEYVRTILDRYARLVDGVR